MSLPHRGRGTGVWLICAAMSSVKIHPSLIRALQARARRERITVDRLVKRLIGDALQQLDDYEAVKAFRDRSGGTTALVDVKKRLGLDRAARRRG
jgi:hypothetical protein